MIHIYFSISHEFLRSSSFSFLDSPHSFLWEGNKNPFSFFPADYRSFNKLLLHNTREIHEHYLLYFIKIDFFHLVAFFIRKFVTFVTYHTTSVSYVSIPYYKSFSRRKIIYSYPLFLLLLINIKKLQKLFIQIWDKIIAIWQFSCGLQYSIRIITMQMLARLVVQGISDSFKSESIRL